MSNLPDLLPVQLPRYYIEPSVMLVWDDGVLKHTNGGYCNYVFLNEEIEPSLEAAQALLDMHVPKEFHGTCSYVEFTARQPLKKVRYGQGELADDGNVYVGFMEFSVDVIYWHFARMGYEWDDEKDKMVQCMKKAYKKKSSSRLCNHSKNVDGNPVKIYIKPDVIE